MKKMTGVLVLALLGAVLSDAGAFAAPLASPTPTLPPAVSAAEAPAVPAFLLPQPAQPMITNCATGTPFCSVCAPLLCRERCGIHGTVTACSDTAHTYSCSC